MVKLMGKFRKLARAGAGVLLLHHKNAAGERARGGTSITNLTDMAIKAAKSENDTNVIELREERFRMCGRWEIDFKSHWDAGPLHDFAKHYQLELLRDQTASEIAKEKKEESMGEQREDRRRVSKAINENPRNAPSTVANKIRMDRNKFDRIAAALSMKYDKDSKSWSIPETDVMDAEPSY